MPGIAERDPYFSWSYRGGLTTTLNINLLSHSCNHLMIRYSHPETLKVPRVYFELSYRFYNRVMLTLQVPSQESQ